MYVIPAKSQEKISLCEALVGVAAHKSLLRGLDYVIYGPVQNQLQDSVLPFLEKVKYAVK